MNCEKGDLVLVQQVDGTNITCIVLSHFEASDYLYCYCVEEARYKLIYRRDIQCILSHNFAPEYPEDEFFDLDYSFYAACYEAYNYYPSQVPPEDDDDDDD